MSPTIKLIITLWVAAFALAYAFDARVAGIANRQGWEKPSSKRPDRTGGGRPMQWNATTFRVTEAIKSPGEYWFTAVSAGAAWAFSKLRWRAAVIVALAGAMTSVNGLIKWIVGRRRPVTGLLPTEFDPFIGGFEGLFGGVSDLSFPSGHACLAFATATALALLFPRAKWIFYAVAALTAAERVFENAHWLSDAVAGAALGAGCAYVAYAIVRRYTATESPAACPISADAPVN